MENEKPAWHGDRLMDPLKPLPTAVVPITQAEEI